MTTSPDRQHIIALMDQAIAAGARRNMGTDKYGDSATLNGRWPNRDPITERGGLNLNLFVENQSVNLIDVLGKEIFDQMAYALVGVEIQGACELADCGARLECFEVFTFGVGEAFAENGNFVQAMNDAEFDANLMAIKLGEEHCTESCPNYVIKNKNVTGWVKDGNGGYGLLPLPIPPVILPPIGFPPIGQPPPRLNPPLVPPDVI